MNGALGLIGVFLSFLSDVTYGGSALPPASDTTSDRCAHIWNICHGTPSMTCLSTLYSHLCVSTFESEMTSLNSSLWCNWGSISGYYINLSSCTEALSDCLLIPWPNRLTEETFVDIHRRYFKDCPEAEQGDPPPLVLFALVITPVFLIPLMVILVTYKTVNWDDIS